MIQAFSKKLREARNFALSLLTENYVFVLEYVDENRMSAFFKLRHRYNGNVMKLSVQKGEFVARKNNKIVHQSK